MGFRDKYGFSEIDGGSAREYEASGRDAVRIVWAARRYSVESGIILHTRISPCGHKVMVYRFTSNEKMERKSKAGRPSRYGFESIGYGEFKQYKLIDGIPSLEAVRKAAEKYGARNGVKFKTRVALDKQSIWIGNGTDSGLMNDINIAHEKGSSVYGFDKMDVGDCLTYSIGQSFGILILDSLDKVRTAALKFGKRNGVHLKTKVIDNGVTIAVKRFS